MKLIFSAVLLCIALTCPVISSADDGLIWQARSCDKTKLAVPQGEENAVCGVRGPIQFGFDAYCYYMNERIYDGNHTPPLFAWVRSYPTSSCVVAIRNTWLTNFNSRTKTGTEWTEPRIIGNDVVREFVNKADSLRCLGFIKNGPPTGTRGYDWAMWGYSCVHRDVPGRPFSDKEISDLLQQARLKTSSSTSPRSISTASRRSSMPSKWSPATARITAG